MEDFGQKVDLTRRIREVLTNYPEGTTVLKEIIQNADDAGATKVAFCLDHRVHGTDSLLCKELKEWQGPALLAYNNSQFTEEDFVSISRIGDSQKRVQPWKTGRFGVGFNSVYHLTDLPSFVSGKYVVFFDPQGKYLPNVSAANPGKRIEYVNSAAISLYKDQFSPYCAFDSDMKNSYSGTLFRFPLRNMEQAAVSKLSRQSYFVEDIASLFTQFYTEAVLTMLFLKNVTTLEIYVWNTYAQTPERIYSCYLESPNSELVWHRQALLRLSNLDRNTNTVIDTFLLDVVSEAFGAAKNEEKRVDSFMIVQSMASSSGRIGVLANSAAKEHDLHLLPWASVAACISDNATKDHISRAGRAFCSLPLPVRTGLPVHVNGYFEISSNRRDIWYGADMDRGGKLRSDWNTCLLQEVVAPAFSELLVKASKLLGPTELYYSLWPCGRFEEPWETLVKQIYRNVGELPTLYTYIDGGRWIRLADAYLHDKVFLKSKELADVLILLGVPVVQLPNLLVNMVLSYSGTSLPKMVSPGTVRVMLRKLMNTSHLLDREQTLLLLDYCLDDVVDEEVGEVASGLSLIPLANGEYGVFEEGTKGTAYFICNDSENRLLGILTDRIVDRNIPLNLLNRLSDIAHTSKTNITFFNCTHLLHLLPQILPADWRYKEVVEWMPDTYRDHPTRDWIMLFWCYLRDHCEDISKFLDFPLLPTTSGHLSRASTNSKMINGRLLPDSMKELLVKVGCQILSPDFEVEHPQLSLYVRDISASGILDVIFEVAHRQESQLGMLFHGLSVAERRELRYYLLNPQWYGGQQVNGGQITRSHMRICKRLPIFEVYSEGTHDDNYIFTDLAASQKFLVPFHVDRLLLGPDFLYSSSESEDEVFLRFYGIERIGRPLFYKLRLFSRISEISPPVLEEAMLLILQELPQLCMQDPSIREILKKLEFVPTFTGRLRCPSVLYDPRNEELYDLLEDHDCFPCGKFREAGVLDMLQGLGLRTVVTPATILQSAKQIESLMHEYPAKAHSKGKVLLSYLEVNANKWLPQRPDDGHNTVNKMLTKVASAFQLHEASAWIDLTKFWNDLTVICWCPVLINPPYPLLPWPSVSTTVAPPKLVRLVADVWLVSASMRILDGECRSHALSHHFGWTTSPGGSIIAAQLLELGKNHEFVADQVFRQALALSMPRIYSVLTAMVGTDEMDIVKAILEGSRWVWVGDGFAKVDEVVLNGPLHLAPYVRIIPVDLAVFKELFLELGVRESLSPRDFAMVLSKMAVNKAGSPLDMQELRAAVLIVQYLADSLFHDNQMACYIPDASSILMPAAELAYNDAPWLSNSSEWSKSRDIPSSALTANKKVPKFVHANISNDVAERLGVCSFRRLLLAESADSVKLGLHGAAEAFGQHEALTTRLKHIVEMYADGPGILFELVQNADDAGASEVCFLLDKTQYGTSSLLSPQMADWQGPALYCYNNSVFTAQDLYAISRIGQDSKLEKPFAIGRFGLGFNCVYHFTDIPGFVSGENMVMFDPHASNLPGITPSHPGLRISFVGRGILEQFPDQFSPYLHFGCDLQNHFPGTLFRFPLRTSNVAASSQIKKEGYRPESVVSLFSSFYTSAGEALLFLRNVMSISLYVKEGPSHEMLLMHRVSRRPINILENQSFPAKVMLDFVHGDRQAGIDKEQFYQRLQRTPDAQLPWSCGKVVVTSIDTTAEKSDLWIVSECLGGGRAKAKSVALENRARSFIPWAGVAAKMQFVPENEENCEGTLVENNNILQSSSTTFGCNNVLQGRAFCFLPLPINTGLPVHVNAYFELSSNRRDIWFGDDMSGGGKLRSDWNCLLLEDAAAPAYARLLANIAPEIGPRIAYYMLWPTTTERRPWTSLMRKVYASIVDLELCVLYTKARGGQWISAKRAILPDYSFSEVDKLGIALAEAGLPLIDAPKSVVVRFQEFCPSLRYLTPHLLRNLLIRRKHGFKERDTMLITLKYCLDDVDETSVSDKLDGLPLLPLATGLFTMFTKSGQSENFYVTSQIEYDLLKDTVPYLLIDCTIDEHIFGKLQRIAYNGDTNISLLTSCLLEELMPKILPAEWQGSKAVLWIPGHQGQPSLSWMTLLWDYLKSTCADLTIFSKWPLLPATDGHLLQLVRNSNVIKDEGWSENMCSLLKKTGCFVLWSDLQIYHPALGDYVQNATASGVLNALLTAAGDLQNLKQLFTDVSQGELRELRSFLCQSKWFSTGQIDSRQINTMKALPIFEAHGSRAFVNLLESAKWLKPDGVDDEMISDSFIHTASEREYNVLENYLGIKRPSKDQFYREHVVNRLPEFASRAEVMLKVIQELKAIIEEDSSIRKLLSELPFILTTQGSLQKPSRLYDPRVPELQLLLHKDAFFPSREFRAPEILDFLVRVGLRNSLGLKGLLDSARSVAMLCEEGQEEEAFKRAKILIEFINKMELRNMSREQSQVRKHEDGNNNEEGEDGTSVSSPNEKHNEMDVDIAWVRDRFMDNQSEEEFWRELANTSWCPVYVDPPMQGIPWPKSIKGSIAPPKAVRLKAQMWLVSSTMRILDGECCSSHVQQKLGWLDRPNVGVLAAQLIELSKAYGCAKSKSDSNMKELLDAALQREIPTLYSLMQEFLGTDDLEILQSLLDGIQWVWIGDGFVSSKELAFDSPAKFQPYLYVVPSELSSFRSLLTALGVRMTFDITDYVRVLQHLNEDMKGMPLSSEQLSFVLRVLEAVADTLSENVASDIFLCSILVPDASGILAPVQELVYNDAPWLAKSNIESQHFVHSSISNDLAERLGAKSLRYMSFIDQEMTKDLPCMDHTRITELLQRYGNDDLLLFDLLEIADQCQAKKLHIIYDKREHPRQSLLQPNLGEFQGPALIIAFEGTVLSMEEICILHLNPPWKLRGQTLSYGSGLLSCYRLCDLPFIVSDGFLYLFDPLGLVLNTSLNRGDSIPSRSASAKMYSLRGTDLPGRFQDQFLPLSVSKTLSWGSSASTIIRMPLKSNSAEDSVQSGDQRIKHLFNKFKDHGSAVLLFLKSVEQVSLSTWETGESFPCQKYAVSVGPTSAIVRSLFPEKKWRKFQISNLFSSSSVATKLHTIDLCIVEDGSQITDKWLVAITLGSGQTRNMALDRRYMSYNLAPIAGVAANVSRNGKAMRVCSDNCILSPLPLTFSVSMPVTIFGCFLICHNAGRYLFENEAFASALGNKNDTHNQLIASWNKELMACVRDSYVELMVEFQRLRKDPLTSRMDLSIAQVVSGILQISADRVYSFWPRSKPKRPSSNQLTSTEGFMSTSTVPDAEWQCLVEKVIRPFYSRLVELPVWQIYGGTVVKASEGMFLATPGTDAADHSPPATVCSFIKEHYPVFAVPGELVREIEAIGVVVKEITPKMVRTLLKASPASIVLRLVETYIDILEYCFSDLQLQHPSISSSINMSPDHQDTSLQDHANQVNVQNNTNITRNRILSDPIMNSTVGQSHLHNSRASFQRAQNFLPGSSSDAGGDALEIVTSFGRALLDFGRGVVEDFSRAGGPPTHGDNIITNGYDVGDITMHMAYIVGEAKGLPCPTATKHLQRLGVTELWVANKEQQTIMQPLAVKFIHLQCFDRPHLTEVFGNCTVQRLLKLQPFSPQLLSAHLKLVFSPQWVSYVNDMGNSPWVSWDYGPGSQCKGPSPDWLRLFWKNIGSSLDELRLFSDWPLIPAITSTSVLCRIKQCNLIFIPPDTEHSSVDTSSNRIMEGTQIGDSSSMDSDLLVDTCIKAFEMVELKQPWLFPLLKCCNVPVYNKCFMDCNALQCCFPKPGQTLGQVVISKLLAAKQAGCFSANVAPFSTADCDELFSLFASDFSPSPSLVPTYSTEELDMLRSLPIYRTVVGTYTSVSGQDHCIICPGAFFQPVDERCLCHYTAASGGLLYHVLGVPELQNEELLVKFGLPGFEQKNEHDQECILIFIYLNWEDLQFENIVVSALKDTKFVKSGAHEVSSQLFKPQELLDPGDSLLKSVFAGDSSKFPGGRFATDGWLNILRKAGLRTASEPEMLLECARKVELLAKEFTSDTENSDAFDAEFSSFKDELSLEIWSLASSVVESILKQFSLVYGSSFCNLLSQIAFVPAEKGMPNIAGRKGGKRVLTSYSEAILLRDWPLAWTCTPILARQNVIPPDFSWGALHLRSPPPFPTVLRHLQIVGKSSGEETLARWPTNIGMKSVEEAFGDVLKYLNNIWGTISSSDILELQKVSFIPVANGTRLVTASALYVRLGVNLAPFAFELPSLYLPYVRILREIGLQETPTFDSARNLLVQIQQASGYQHLNPNELRAVLLLLQFICDEGKKSQSDGTLFPAHDAIVPDEGCRLVHARACVYIDPRGSCLLSEIDTSRLRFVNPQLSEELCVQIGVKKLSDVVVEELDQSRPLEMLTALGSFFLKMVASKMLSQSFQSAVWMVIQNFKEHVPALRYLTNDEVTKVLESAAEKLQFVRSVYTRFIMLPSSVDITLDVPNIKQGLCEEWRNEAGHRVLQFVDRSKQIILVGEPPDAVAISDILAVVVSRLLDSPLCLPISTLFNVPIGMEVRALDLLRLASLNRNALGHCRSSLHQGSLIGHELIPSDAMQVQFHPLRPFYAGEVIAWRSDSEEGLKLKYGKVPEDVRPSAGQALYRLKIETAPGKIEILLSSNVLSFRSMEAGSSSSMGAENREAFIRSGNQHIQRVQGVRKANAEDMKVSIQNQEIYDPTVTRVSTSEIVHAVADMLSVAGIPMGIEQQSLLQKTLALQEQLATSQAALVVEQERADSAVKEADTARTAWSCRVCLNSEIDTMLVPCGHVLCQGCCSAVARCPFCRRQVSKALRMYRP